MPTPKRQRGDFGELAARKYLKKNGYRIRAANYEACGYELDIVAEDRDHIVFAEVKTRRLAPSEATVLTRPCAAVDKEKRRHIIVAARLWLSAHPKRAAKKCRFDILEVYLDPSKSEDSLLHIHHILGAFTA